MGPEWAPKIYNFATHWCTNLVSHLRYQKQKVKLKFKITTPNNYLSLYCPKLERNSSRVSIFDPKDIRVEYLDPRNSVRDTRSWEIINFSHALKFLTLNLTYGMKICMACIVAMVRAVVSAVSVVSQFHCVTSVKFRL